MEKTLLLAFPLLLFGIVLAAPGDLGLVVSSTEPSKNGRKEGTKQDSSPPRNPEIYEMDITSNISNRFAKTLVVSKVKNAEKLAKETTFTIVLPEKAFISEFVMEIGGKSYKAYVKEKEEAKQIYNQAVSSGQSAGHVAVSTRNSNKFTVSVNIEPESKVVFLLTYEELLERRNNQYELIVNIHPGQIVKDLSVKVQINETRPLKFVRTPSLRSGNEISKNDDKLNPSSVIETTDSKIAVVKFNPDSENQKQFARHLGEKESDGLSGQFVVQYDVERDPHGGEVLLQDGYFVHFFAPNDLEPLPKHVLLVLDSSGSMDGTKINQVKDAVKSILNELRQNDIISILDFGNDVSVWDVAQEKRTPISFGYGTDYDAPFTKLSKVESPSPLEVNNQTLAKAKKVTDTIWAYGGTNIIGALESALYLAKVVQDHPSETKYQPIVIFLTDGEPNVRVYSTESIINIVTKLNKENNKVPIYSLSFGEDADKDFLRKLSLKNYGFSRHIYEAADASLQIQEFYKQVSSPLLTNIRFKYNEEVKEVTRTKFPLYFEGSEIVVTGRYDGVDPNLSIARPVHGWGFGPKVLPPVTQKPVTSLERLWAYLTIKQTLDERELAHNKTELTKKALDLALKYSFVTDITSLVVVKPNETRSVNTEDAYDDKRSSDDLVSYRRLAASYPASNLYSQPRSSYALSAANSASYPASNFYYQPASSYALSAGNSFAPMRSYHHASASLYDSSGAAGLSYQHSFSHRGPSRADIYASLPAPQPVQPFMLASLVPPPSPRPQFVPRTTSTTSSPKLVDALPWLASKLNSNGTLTIDQNVYELGEFSYPFIMIEKGCPQTPLNANQPGTCSTLSLCPQVHSYLTDFSVYQQYFCPIETTGKKYAGVCCPLKSQRIN